MNSMLTNVRCTPYLIVSETDKCAEQYTECTVQCVFHSSLQLLFETRFI